MNKLITIATIGMLCAVPAYAQVQDRGPDERPIGPNGKVCEFCETPNERAAHESRNKAASDAGIEQLKRELGASVVQHALDAASAASHDWYEAPSCLYSLPFMNPDAIETSLRQTGTFAWRRNGYDPAGNMLTVTVADIGGHVYQVFRSQETCKLMAH